MSWLISFARAREFLLTVGFEPGTLRLRSEGATTELRRIKGCMNQVMKTRQSWKRLVL